MPSLQPSKAPNYFNFGFLPSGNLRVDINGRLFGHPNLIKRLQAPDLMRALDIQSGDTVLDFGCGAGFMTVEMAKLAAKATGIDVNPYVKTIAIPRSLAGRLEYLQTSGATLPFPSSSFDRILASEILPMIPDPRQFMAEIKRVLKPGGRIVVANGTGPIPIRDAYRDSSPQLQALRSKYPGKVPATYEEYCAQFQVVAGTAQSRFLTEEEILRLVADHGFMVSTVMHSPRNRAASWLAWRQFRYFVSTGKVVMSGNFLLQFFALSLLSAFDREGYPGGLIVVGTASK